jgi:hypothetical protein
MQRIDYPLPLFLDLHGALLDAGYIYIGVANADPEVSPLACFWNSGLTTPAAQPFRTRGGYIVNSGLPSNVYTAATDYSIRIRDADGNLISYIPSAQAGAGAAYQPLDSDLTAIAAQGTQPFGRSLLNAASAMAARALLSLGNYLASSGGTVTGNIVRSGAGPHLYHATGAYTSGKLYTTNAGAADPTSADGEIWLELAP